jgi:hypothetical protein
MFGGDDERGHNGVAAHDRVLQHAACCIVRVTKSRAVTGTHRRLTQTSTPSQWREIERAAQVTDEYVRA